ncbi:hypothetical protein [Alcaligenes aquatilis]|uniref:hypothetical protein n=1 Tax=Alcaligenes aquatilis TaxID=323284 RepID=UPI003F8D998E
MLVDRIKLFCTAVGADIKALWAAVNGKMPRRGLYVNHGNANERRYYLIGRITNNNGSVRIKGLIGGHDINVQGGGAVDLSIHSRAGNIPIVGFVAGNMGLQDLQVYKSATNEVFIYLVSGQYGLTDLEYSETLGGTVYFSPGFTLETPVHTLIFSAAALAPGLGLLRLVGGVEATPTAAGLLSAVDKEKLDGLAVGGGVPAWTSEGRPNSGSVRFGFNTTWGGLEYWNGSIWIRLQGERAYSTTFGNGRFGNKF